jgi:ADP-heptose:LPS heptosyltransferase
LKELEILFRKFLLKLLLLTRRRKKVTSLPTFTKESKILFIRLNRIGDALVATPLLKEIKSKIGCKIYVLASSSNYFIFENKKLTDEIIVYRKNMVGISKLIRMINQIGFDAIVDLHNDVSSTASYLMAFSKSSYKFGLTKENDKLFTHTVKKLDPSKHHVIDRVLEFEKLFGIEADYDEANIVFSYSKEADDKSKAFLEEHFLTKKFLVGINISAGSEARFWGVDNFKKLVHSFSSYDVSLIIMCPLSDLQKAQAISESIIPIFYNPIFEEFAAMIDSLNLLFTPDTSIVHIASAFKVPVFGLYVKYNTNDKIWSPYKSEFECIITEEPTLHNVTFNSVNHKLIPFFEKLYYEYSNKNM